MKYIRTKYGIFELESTYEYLGKTYYCIKEQISSFVEKEIIKQADTIEELCDYWDYYDIGDKKYLIKEINTYTLNHMKISLELKCKKDIRLCVRTNKGLIYVAKLNDKGEIELL